jgi:SAM-dependent methyltransferase
MNALAVKKMLKRTINAPFHVLGYEIRQWRAPEIPQCAGQYPHFLQEAERAGMDVNDWLEHELKWTGNNEVLKQDVFPYLGPASIVCELGPGTGRSARKVLSRLPRGELHLVDCSPWFINFQKEYFRLEPRVHVHQNDGCSLPFFARSCLDLIYSFGSFIQFRLSTIYLYSQEFFRVLRPGGYLVVEYIDVLTPEGWALLESQSSLYGINDFFTYYVPELVEKVFGAAGFEIIANDHTAQWLPGHPFRILIARKEAEAARCGRSVRG